MSGRPVFIVTATLHTGCGQRTRNGRWIKEPTATYSCNRCFYTETVRGFERVLAFQSHIRHTHDQACPSAAATGRKTAA